MFVFLKFEGFTLRIRPFEPAKLGVGKFHCPWRPKLAGCHNWGWWWRRRSSWQTQKRRLHVGRKAKGHVRLDLQKSGTSSEVIDTLANLDSGATDFLRWLGSARWVRSPQMRCQWTRTHAWPSRSQHPQAETWARPSSHSRCNPTHLRIGARVLPWASRWWLSLTSRKLVGRSPIMFKQNHIFWPWHTRELGLIPWIVMKKIGIFVSTMGLNLPKKWKYVISETLDVRMCRAWIWG